MKVKLLLCMMVLGLLGTAAQPRVTDNGLIKMPTPFPVLTKTIPTESPTTPKRATKAKADAVTHQVDFVLDFDPENQLADEISLVNNKYYLNSYAEPYELYELVNGSNVMTVPAGTYDIIVKFIQVDVTQEESNLYVMYVIREQVTISENMQLNFAASEAKNHIHFETLTPEGEPVNLGRWAVDEEYVNWTVLEPGNTDFMQCYKDIYCDDIGWLVERVDNYDVTIEEGPHRRTGHEFRGDFFVNDVSERYTFYTYRWGVSGHDVFTVSHEVQGASGDLTITNNPNDYTLFQDPFKAQKHQDEDLCLHLLVYNQLPGNTSGVNQLHLTMPTPLAEGEMCRYYIGASIDDSRVGYMPFLEPSVGPIVTETTPWGWVQQQYVPALVGMRMTKTNGELVFANNGVASVLTRSMTTPKPPIFDIELQEGSDIIKYPLFAESHPQFTYSTYKKIGNYGNNCPILVAVTGIDEFEDFGVRQMIVDHDYIGRYGEKKADDIIDAQIQVYANGELYRSYENGAIDLDEDELTSGEADIYITNSYEAVTVDDLACSNKAQMHIAIGGEDQYTPTATMLHFKAANGDVTDRFATAHDGTLEFTAGDFSRRPFIDAEDYFYLTYDRQAPESVEVSYSPYGEDAWNELPVEEVPENYWPVMGWFYTGSLAGVTGEALNGWFDLKIRLTDAAGNWQEQVISPAFRIDDLAYSSVATVGSDNAHEVARYNLAGQRVDANATGVVVIKMSDGTARKVIVR